MDLRKLKTLIDLVAESGITELDLTEGESRVRIVKSTLSSTAPEPMVDTTFTSPRQVEVTSISPPVEEPDELHAVKSPMVGTFYRAPSPGSAAFVNVGDTIIQGQVLCIIEAMKLLNEIQADKAGKVKAVLVENGQAVEYGQKLFLIH
jgi:acetyl-CoA carboxylase biotin carboxyl carrier protein